jgi:preprotein translocase subunit SecD
MLRRVAFVLLMAATLAACDRFMEAARGAAAPIDDSGAYLVLELDTSAVIRDQLERASENMASALRDASPSIRYAGRGVLGDAARIRLVDPADLPRAREALQPLATTLVLTDDETGLIEARLTPAALDAGTGSLVTESIAVLQRRTAAHRLSLAPLGSDQLIARTAGPAFPANARAALTTTAQLSFHLVHEISPEEAAGGRIPRGAMVVQPYPGVGYNAEVVVTRPSITGARLSRVRAQTDQYTGELVLAFQLDDEGREQFCAITRQHINERFAILVDNQVMTAPRINEPICGGSGQISGNFTRESVNSLAASLDGGGLPVGMIVVAEGVGPYTP